MTRAVTRDPARCHFPSLRHKLGNGSDIFIVDSECLIGAESTNFATKHGSPTGSALLVIRPLATRSRACFSLCHGSFLSLSSFFLHLVAGPFGTRLAAWVTTWALIRQHPHGVWSSVPLTEFWPA